MLHGIVVRRSFVTSVVTGEEISSGDMGGERSVEDTKVARGRSLDISKSNTKSIKKGNDVGQEEKGECDQELLRKNLV